MEKAKVDVGKVLTVEEARPLVREFGFELHELTKVYGGYSGANYRARVSGTGGGSEHLALLKIVHAPEAEVRAQLRLLCYLRACGYRGTAFPFPNVTRCSGAAGANGVGGGVGNGGDGDDDDDATFAGGACAVDKADVEVHALYADATKVCGESALAMMFEFLAGEAADAWIRAVQQRFVGSITGTGGNGDDVDDGDDDGDDSGDGGRGGGGGGDTQHQQASVHVLERLGESLAALHAVPPPPTAWSGSRRATSGGACTCFDVMRADLDPSTGVLRHFAARSASGGGCESTMDMGGAASFVDLARARLGQVEAALRAHCDGDDGPGDGGGAPGGVRDAILHGDPFLDNVLVHPEPVVGERGAGVRTSTDACANTVPDPTAVVVSGIVDWEDICIGPRVYDLACAAIGCCCCAQQQQAALAAQPHGDGVGHGVVAGIDLALLAALLRGYSRACCERDDSSGAGAGADAATSADPPLPSLSRAERAMLVDAMQGSLLCNAFFRYRKFRVGGAADVVAIAPGGESEAGSGMECAQEPAQPQQSHAQSPAQVQALQRERQLPPALQNAHVELVQRMLALDSAAARQRLHAVIN